MKNSTVRFERDGAIAQIVLSNPPLNRLNLSMVAELRDAIRQAGESDARVLVLSADGENFAVGAEAHEWVGKNSDWFRMFAIEAATTFHLIESLKIPTIASVQGSAIGGGFELALACDLLVVADNAVLLAAEAKAGMIPVAGGAQRLAERIGRALAARIVMLAEPVSGSQAATLGIATHVAPAGELRRVTLELAQRLAAGPTLAFAAARSLLKAWSSGGVATADALLPDLVSTLWSSGDAQNSLAAIIAALKENKGLPQLAFSGK